LAQERQRKEVDAAIAEYQRLSPYATGDSFAISGEVNRMGRSDDHRDADQAF
jgi:hypothetical protein